MLVSVLIPAFNVERFIADALRSVLEQTMSDINVVVVNDGSTDGTLEVVRNVAKQDSRVA
ncbi:MAG: glycosyltransferase family 2 protein, partial [Candidatus Acidiferrales bacterium]